MFGHGLAIPVILDTNTSAAHLALQWARNFHYGHMMMPPISLYAIAGASTASVIPFTLTFMMGINNVLAGWNKEFKRVDEKVAVEGRGGATIENVQKMVARWGYLHCVRSMMPLVGAFVGLATLLRELSLPARGEVLLAQALTTEMDYASGS
ncbi:hypothetical protein LTR28_001814 [Elasticomyces elasticus]|nr:hypothetical protein LTR28_001814 [Elasticomyces elasticus]